MTALATPFAAPADDPALDRRWIAASVVSRADNEKVIAAGVPRRWIETGCFRRFGVEQGKIALPVNPVPADEQAFATWVPGDLVYFDLEQPERWSTVHGSPFLNPQAIEFSAYYREPLVIAATPLDWMRGGGAGIVVLDRRINLRRELAGVRCVIVGDLEFGSWIERKHRVPILVRRKRVAA